MDAAAILERQRDEQIVIEAQMRSRATPSETSKNEDVTSPTSGFGSSLEQNTTVRLMRARSESLSSTDQEPDLDSLSSLAMTPEDRRALEAEMKAQHTHPLARQVEQEAEERRLENERNYYRTHSGRLLEVGTAGMLRANSGRMSRMSNGSILSGGQRISGRDWNEMMDAFGRSRSGQVSSLDDLMVLEAAILLSMDEESRRLALNSSETDGQERDATQHALNGFPLFQQSYRSLHGFGGSLRGISEAEQIELAIALSLQQAQQRETALNDESVENAREEASTPGRLEAREGTEEPPGGSTSVNSVEGVTESNNESCSNAEGEADGNLVFEVVETTNDCTSDSEGQTDASSGGESSSGSCSCSGSETSTGSGGAVSMTTEGINGNNDGEANLELNSEGEEAPANLAVRNVGTAEQVDDGVGVAFSLSHDTVLSSEENRDG